VPGATQACALAPGVFEAAAWSLAGGAAGFCSWASADAAASAVNTNAVMIGTRNATLLIDRWFEAVTMDGSTVSTGGPGRVHVGCSGWVYKHWYGILYPEGLAQKRWFERYAEEFDTVEINASFYRLPKAETFDGWRNKAPPGFRYAVKVNRFITHLKKLAGVEEAVAEFAGLARRLEHTLGPLLYQLPPSLKLDLDRLEAFLKLIPADLSNVFEFRNKSWYVPETYALLDRYGAAFCVHDMPGLASERVAVGPVAYVRFHGGEGKYWGRYADERLLSWTDWIVEQSRQGRATWCYFNNDIHGHAIHDAQTLKGMLGQALR
jgi:uncharacterized protein YecE (DUF72 family)